MSLNFLHTNHSSYYLCTSIVNENKIREQTLTFQGLIVNLVVKIEHGQKKNDKTPKKVKLHEEIKSKNQLIKFLQT